MRRWGVALIFAGPWFAGCYMQIETTDDMKAESTESETVPEPEDLVIKPTDLLDTMTSSTCGDGILDADETCDDGNTEDGDGCSKDCKTMEGMDTACGPADTSCHPLSLCGDGKILLPEICDDGNLQNGDGCSDTCQIEEGFLCIGEPSRCLPTVCGDGVQDGAEQCDDGNTVPFDGCSPLCQKEPECAVGEPCDMYCGDGMVYGDEMCDDGNLIDGDGCSSMCVTEAGYECDTSAEPPETVSLPLIVRDFRDDHPDFWSRDEREASSLPYNAFDNKVDEMLSSDKKPVLTEDPFVADSTWDMIRMVSSAESFDRWYDTDPEATVVTSMVLFRDETTGSYVNRDSPDGAFWERLGIQYVGNPRFFPIDGQGITPESEYGVTQIPPEYFGSEVGSTETCQLGNGCNPCAPIECVTGESDADCARFGEPLSFYDCYDDCPRHNFLFTTEMTFWYTYRVEGSYVIEYVGHGDIGVFMNGHLIMGMKGIDSPPDKNSAHGDELGMVDGQTYEVRIFFAQRHSQMSTFRLKLSGFETIFAAMGDNRSECETVCGDGIRGPDEECDSPRALLGASLSLEN